MNQQYLDTLAVLLKDLIENTDQQVKILEAMNRTIIRIEEELPKK